jgi:hypothetical protein
MIFIRVPCMESTFGFWLKRTIAFGKKNGYHAESDERSLRQLEWSRICGKLGHEDYR